MSRCCAEPDVVIAKDPYDMTIKTFCEACGQVFFTVTWEFWERSIEAGRHRAAIQLVTTLMEH